MCSRQLPPQCRQDASPRPSTPEHGPPPRRRGTCKRSVGLKPPVRLAQLGDLSPEQSVLRRELQEHSDDRLTSLLIDRLSLGAFHAQGVRGAEGRACLCPPRPSPHRWPWVDQLNAYHFWSSPKRVICVGGRSRGLLVNDSRSVRGVERLNVAGAARPTASGSAIPYCPSLLAGCGDTVVRRPSSCTGRLSRSA